MKYITTFLIMLTMLAGCQNPITDGGAGAGELGGAPENDTRLALIVDAVSAEWIAYPGGAVARKINDKAEVREKCNKPKHSYIFFDDEAVIGYEPPVGDLDGSVMSRAVAITVELHNRDNPGNQWAYISVPPPPTPPPVTENDPVLAKWQFALVLDDGTIVQGPYTAEFDWEWAGWKGSIARQVLELYNRDNDPDAHIVWGTDE